MAVIVAEDTAAAYTQNPLDTLEEIVAANAWAFDRPNPDEMFVEVAGRWCRYRLYFFWADEVSAMQLTCEFDMTVPTARHGAMSELMLAVNERMWLGHFDFDSDTHQPIFRHTTLLRGSQGASVEQLEDLVDIAVTECERFYPAFQFCIWGGKTPEEAVAAAILDTVAEA